MLALYQHRFSSLQLKEKNRTIKNITIMLTSVILLISMPSYGTAVSATAKTQKPTTESMTEQVLPLQQAINLYEQKELIQAEKRFKQLAQLDDTRAMAYVYLARIALAKEDSEQAEQAIEKALKVANNHAEIYALSGVVYANIAQKSSIFSALGYAKKSLQGFQKAVELSPEKIEYRQMLMGFYLGAPSIAGGDEELGMEQAQAINQLDQKQGYIAIGEALMAMGKKKALANHLVNTPDSLQQDSEVLLGKGFIYQQQENYAKAINHFQQAIKYINDNNDTEQEKIKLQALYQLGKTSDLSKTQLSEGIAALSEYIQISPQGNQFAPVEWAKFRLANLMAKQGDQEKAKRLYQEIARNTQDENLKDKIEDLL